jgi:hypothetical protein
VPITPRPSTIARTSSEGYESASNREDRTNASTRGKITGLGAPDLVGLRQLREERWRLKGGHQDSPLGALKAGGRGHGNIESTCKGRFGWIAPRPLNSSNARAGCHCADHFPLGQTADPL